MSLDTNKRDFERALELLEDEVASLEGIIHGDFLSLVKDVISEYDGHYKDDIVELIDNFDDLEDKYNQLVEEKDG